GQARLARRRPEGEREDARGEADAEVPADLEAHVEVGEREEEPQRRPAPHGAPGELGGVAAIAALVPRLLVELGHLLGRHLEGTARLHLLVGPGRAREQGHGSSGRPGVVRVDASAIWSTIARMSGAPTLGDPTQPLPTGSTEGVPLARTPARRAF